MSMKPGSTNASPTSTSGACVKPATRVVPLVTASMRPSRIQTRPGSGSSVAPCSMVATLPAMTSSLISGTHFSTTGGQVRAAVGTVTVIVARFICAVSPVRRAHASNAHIQAGSPGGRSAGGMTVRSACVIVAP